MSEEKKKFKLDDILKDKKKVFIIFVIIAAIMFYFSTQSNQKNKKIKQKQTKQTKILKSPKEAYMNVILNSNKENKKKKESNLSQIELDNLSLAEKKKLREKKKKLRTLVIEKSQVSTRSKKQRPTRRGYQYQLSTSVERVRAIYDVRPIQLTPVSVEARLARVKETYQKPQEENAQEENKSIKEEKKKEEKTEIISPGSLIKARLLTAIVAPEGNKVHFVAFIEDVSGPRMEFITFDDCYGVGTAQYDPKTNRVNAQLTSIACEDKYSNIEAEAVDENLAVGLKGRHYSRIGQRLALAFVEDFIPTYAEARKKAEEYNSTSVATGADTMVVDFSVKDPEKYALWSAIASWGRTVKEELSKIRQNKVPVTVIDPGTQINFFLLKPSELIYVK